VYEYKVVDFSYNDFKVKDISRKFREIDVEAEINGLAKQGWRLISTSTDVHSVSGVSGTSSYLYLFFERETS